MAGAEHAEELLMIEEADAWFEYLEATRGQNEKRYAEVEPWAWARLTQRLRAVRARRAVAPRSLPELPDRAVACILLLAWVQAMPTFFTTLQRATGRHPRPRFSRALT